MFHIILYNTYKDTNTNIKIKLQTLSWCQTSGKNSRNRRENLTVIEHTQNNNNNNNNNADKFKEEFTVIELR